MLESDACHLHMLGNDGEKFICDLRSWELAAASLGSPLLLMGTTYIAAFAAVTLSHDTERMAGRSGSKYRRGRDGGRGYSDLRGSSGSSDSDLSDADSDGFDRDMDDNDDSDDSFDDDEEGFSSTSGSESDERKSGEVGSSRRSRRRRRRRGRGGRKGNDDDDDRGRKSASALRLPRETRSIELSSFENRSAADNRLQSGTLVKAMSSGWKRPHVGRVRSWDSVTEMYVVEFDAGIRRKVSAYDGFFLS